MTFGDDGLYRDITGFAHDTPGWVQHTMEVWTEAGILVFGALFVALWWRARREDPRAWAVAVLAPAATAVAYVCSELLKSGFEQERPCRAVASAVPSLAECPPVGDWSFPSNHATIAGASAVALVLVRRALAGLVLPLALLMAFSRVFVGVHYPHDVVAGLLLGGVIAFAAVRMAIPVATRLAEASRASSVAAVRGVAGPGPGPGDRAYAVSHRRR